MHWLLAQEAVEHGADHGVERAEVMALTWLPAVTALVVFIVAFGFLYLKVWPKITQALDDRQRKLREEIESAEQAREQARAALGEYERELASARQEAGEMIAHARADAKAAAQELRDRNEAELVQMKQRATLEMENAKRAAITELHAEAANLAADIAGKILKREISAADQKRLIDESLQELAAPRDA